MSNQESQKTQRQTANNQTASGSTKRKAGVPSRYQMYKILKARSLELQSGKKEG